MWVLVYAAPSQLEIESSAEVVLMITTTIRMDFFFSEVRASQLSEGRTLLPFPTTKSQRSGGNKARGGHMSL